MQPHSQITSEAYVAAASSSWRRGACGSQAAIIIDFPRRAPAADPKPVARAAIDTLYRQHNDALVRFLRGRLRNEADAVEAAQEAYVRLLQLSDLQRPECPKAYLFKVAANVATDLLRRHRRARSSDDQMMTGERIEATQERTLVACQQLRAIDRALQQLPAGCRQAFMLNRQQGWSTVRIAEHLGVTDRTARRYLTRALQHLYDTLQGQPDWGYHRG